MKILLAVLFSCFAFCSSGLLEDGRKAVEPEYLDNLLAEGKYEEFNELLGIDIPHLTKPRSEDAKHDPRYSPHLAHGDILPHPTSKPEARNYINMTKWRGSKWGLSVPYSISSNFTAEEKSKIQSYIDACYSEFKSCFTVRPWVKGDVDYIFITSADGCYSNLGRVGGQQVMSLAKNGCIYPGTVCHEFLHALGCHHEQCRADRDNHIRIYWNNIKTEWHSQFEMVVPTDWEAKIGYDCCSVMHYPNYHPDMCKEKSQNAFDFYNCSKDCDLKNAGYANAMSSMDKQKLRQVYCKT